MINDQDVKSAVARLIVQEANEDSSPNRLLMLSRGKCSERSRRHLLVTFTLTLSKTRNIHSQRREIKPAR